MTQIPPRPMGLCEICGKPLDYTPNPNWESVKRFFAFNPSQGYWLTADHPACIARLEESRQSELDKKARDERRASVRRALGELGFARIANDKPFETFHVEEGNRQAHRALNDWSYSKTGILLYGPPGRGKSHLTAAFAKKWTDLGLVVAFQNMSLLLALLRKGYQDDLFDERLRFVSERAEILILDDLGAEKPTEWGEEKLYMIIDTRLRAGLPLFVTTNCSDKELESKFHPRILSRLKETCSWIGVNGRDWREQINNKRTTPGRGLTQ